ncbi:hypothetical protein D7Y21_04555 [Corallococcus sp. AB045]|nr:hypothetical protein D7Y21_04555 [Corallococcus sp. AB045]
MPGGEHHPLGGGHATIEMMMRYAHLSPDNRRTAVNVLDRPLSTAPCWSCCGRSSAASASREHPRQPGLSACARTTAALP